MQYYTIYFKYNQLTLERTILILAPTNENTKKIKYTLTKRKYTKKVD